ncbi:hypothetical protein RB608_03705 [Nocardioides sp. LHD-245]|uniref:hypothetical protein n=1 Tax=Nocardioides sp. LHD-245 TaxID=3051387 RepID=UPI0027E05305|nr:hypothetical protein [Nocardioides sp. LHD-245]
MAVSDGDPRTFDPELFQRLTAWERSYAVRCYTMRLNQVGRGKRNYPDDEAPASVARQAAIYGLVFLGLGLFGLLVSVMIFVALAGVWWEPAARYEIDVGPGTVDAAVVVGVLWALRARQVSGYYVARYPDSLDRWFFRPGFAPASSAAAPREIRPLPEGAPPPAEAARRGAPTAVVPEVMAALTRLERSRVAGRFAWRQRRVGTGDVRYPDDEPAESVARDAVRRGVGSAGWLLVLPVLVAMGYVNVALLVDGSAVGAVGSVICAVVLVVAAVLVARRRRRIMRLFDHEVARG